MDTNKWVRKATNPKHPTRDALRETHGQYGTDGVRLHYAPDLPMVPDHVAAKCAQVLDRARHLHAVVVVSKVALETSCKASRALKDHSDRHATIPPIRLCCNERLDVESGNDVGTIRATWRNGDLWHGKHSESIIYTHAGPDASLLVNTAFLLDALSGFDGESITLHLDNEQLYLQCGIREAVIASMQE